MLIEVNQDDLGQQATFLMEDTANDADFAVYRAPIAKNGAAYIGLLMVNWHNTADYTISSFDLITNQIAETKYDKCTMTDLRTGVATSHNGAPITTLGTLKPHQSIAMGFHCSPF